MPHVALHASVAKSCGCPCAHPKNTAWGAARWRCASARACVCQLQIENGPIRRDGFLLTQFTCSPWQFFCRLWQFWDPTFAFRCLPSAPRDIMYVCVAAYFNVQAHRWCTPGRVAEQCTPVVTSHGQANYQPPAALRRTLSQVIAANTHLGLVGDDFMRGRLWQALLVWHWNPKTLM